MRGRAIRWTLDELAWIELSRALPRAEMLRRFRVWFDRPEVTDRALKQLCLRHGWTTGRSGRFEPGNVPANKGGRMPYHPNSAATRFQPGREPHNRKCLGHERLSQEGYVEISVAETNPHTGYSRRYVQQHRWLREQLHGPVPDGHALKCLDGTRTNTDPANWAAIPRALLPRLNGRFGRGYDRADPQVQPVLLTIAKLEHKARQARKGRG